LTLSGIITSTVLVSDLELMRANDALIVVREARDMALEHWMEFVERIVIGELEVKAPSVMELDAKLRRPIRMDFRSEYQRQAEARRQSYGSGAF
jgi:hypothetical protein